MGRHPWRVRTAVLGVIDAVAVLIIGAAMFSDAVGWSEGAVAAVVAVLSHFEIVDRGEDKTTPIDSPLDSEGLPMLRWNQVQEMLSEERRKVGVKSGEAQVLTDEQLDALPTEDPGGP